MGADNLHVSSADLRELSSTFGQLSGDLDTLYGSIQKSVEDLEGKWSGTASKTFSDNIRATYQTFANAIAYLDGVSKDLDTAATNYDEVEAANSRASV
ncbi:MAG: WXG100 family type VII secretion target [Clostridiales bacterium]|nr:WXG100 family type VII secretion target [Clostridiales bacterium]